MKLYPYNYPLIMTDDIFVAYGGQTGTTSAPMRQASYLLAEELVTDSIGTFLLPTIITGTYPAATKDFWENKRYLITDYGYVDRILNASVLTYNGNLQCSLAPSKAGFLIRNDSYGYIDLAYWFNILCPCSYGTPYLFQIAYEAGLPTGTASNPKILEAITIVAQIDLNEKVFPSANEGVGDIGIQSFSNSGYQEVRKTLMNTTFGNSPRAIRAYKLLNSFRKIPTRLLGK